MMVRLLIFGNEAIKVYLSELKKQNPVHSEYKRQHWAFYGRTFYMACRTLLIDIAFSTTEGDASNEFEKSDNLATVASHGRQ